MSARNPRGEMPFLDHLEELRWRILWSLLAVAIGTVVGLALCYRFNVLGLLVAPVRWGSSDPDLRLVFLSPTAPFFITLKLALVVGFLLASPIVFYQAWAFLAPALEPHEKKAIVPALYFGLVLFACGVAVANLGAMVVVRGPGSFTGVRVGLSTAKGLAQAAGVAVIGVSRLQVLAQKAGSRAAVLDAGRGEIYLGLAGDEAGEALMKPGEVRERVDEREIACCEQKTAEVLTGARMVGAPTAEDEVRYAQGRILGRDFDDLAGMDAHYLRRSEAEIVAERRAAGKAG